MRIHLCALVLVTTMANVLAQERREPIRGSAELPDGTAWAAATIHLLSRPLPHDERLGTPDEVRAVTDDKGRFLVQLLTGRQYLAWAVEELDAKRYRSSFPVERVIAGQPLALVADEPTTRRRLTFNGLERWAGRGEVIGHLLSATEPRYVVHAPLTADGWLLPPMPGRGARLEITCGGLPLQQWPGAVDLRAADDQPWQLPAPRDVRVRVTDDKGQPLAGAELSLRSIDPPDGMRSRDHPLAQTDASGDAVVTLPLPPERDFAWHNYKLGVLARGFAPVGNLQTVKLPASHDAKKDAPALTLPLAIGSTHTLLLRLGERPFTAPLISSTAMATVEPGGFIMQDGDEQRHVTPDANGALTIHRMASMPVLLVAPTASLPPLLRAAMAPVHPVALLGRIRADEQRADLQWDLAALAPRTLAVTLDGIPQSGAQLTVLVEDNDEMVRALSGMVTDRAGRIAALLPKDLEVIVVAWTNSGCAVAKSRNADGEPVPLELERITSLPGTVIDGNGEPVAFATVECYVSAATGSPEARAQATAVKLLRAPTARDGSFALPLLPGMHYSLRGVATPGDNHYLTRKWTVGKNDPEELTLDLSKTR